MPKILEDKQIFLAVAQTIAEKGYSGSTTKQMAMDAGISEVTLFRKFGSKEQLVKQTISFILKEANLQETVKYTGNLHNDLLKFVEIYHNSAVKYMYFVSALFFELRLNPKIIDSIDEPMKMFLGMGKLLARYQSENKLRVEHPLYCLASLLGPLMYVAMLRKGIPESNIPIIDLSQHIQYFLEGRKI